MVGNLISIIAPTVSTRLDATISPSCKSTRFLTIFNPSPECSPNLSGRLL